MQSVPAKDNGRLINDGTPKQYSVPTTDRVTRTTIIRLRKTLASFVQHYSKGRTYRTPSTPAGFWLAWTAAAATTCGSTSGAILVDLRSQSLTLYICSPSLVYAWKLRFKGPVRKVECIIIAEVSLRLALSV